MKNNQTLANGATVIIYPTTTESTSYVVYLHSNGTVYGTKSDLPEELKELSTSNSYTVLALDYLLASSIEVDHILGTLTETFQLLDEGIIQNQPFDLCGRFANDYLVLQLTKQLQTLNLTLQFLVSFYGYTDLELIKEPRKLLKQAISAKEIATIDQIKSAWDGPFLSRCLLYHYSIQQGLLPHFYGLSENKDWSAYALSDGTSKAFPPCFSTASSLDEEVPFRYNKKIGRTIPKNTFRAVYYLGHDFLKQTRDPSIITLFEQLGSWLKER